MSALFIKSAIWALGIRAFWCQIRASSGFMWCRHSVPLSRTEFIASLGILDCIGCKHASEIW